MNFLKNLPDHFFFKDWLKPKSTKLIRPFFSQIGKENKEKIYEVYELDFGEYKIQFCKDGNNYWFRKC